MQVKEPRLDDEVEFDTLSLSDLPLYCDDLQRGEYERQEEISQSEEDFEFSSQELTCSNTISGFPQQDIVFCGKLIAHKQPNLPEKASTLIEHEHQANETKKCAWGLLRWNFSLTRTRTKRRVLFSTNNDKSSNAIMHKNNKIQVSKCQKKKQQQLEREYYGFSGHNKVSILTSSSSGKAKWYLFLFGMSSFSTKIELRDMKNRLRRSSGHSSSRISPPTFGFQNYEEEEAAACKGRIRGWGLLELIKTLNCGRN